MSLKTQAIAACLLLLFQAYPAIAQEYLPADQFYLFMEHDGSMDSTDYVAEGATVTFGGNSGSSNVGSIDETTGNLLPVGLQPTLPTDNGSYAMTNNTSSLDVEITNDSIEGLTLTTINFDYSRLWGKSPSEIVVQYIGGDLDDAASVENPLRLRRYTKIGSARGSRNFRDFSIDLQAVLDDVNLAVGESATFRFAIVRAPSTTTRQLPGYFDNISFGAQQEYEEGDPELLFIEHDGRLSTNEYPVEGITVSAAGGATRSSRTGSTDGSTGDFDVPESIPLTQNGALVIRPGDRSYEFVIENTGHDEIALSAIRFDYNRRYSGNPATIEVEYVAGDLGDPTLIERIENIEPSGIAAGDYADFTVDLRSALSNYSLLQNQSATFRITAHDTFKTRAGVLDNISIDGVINPGGPVGPEGDRDNDGLPDQWELTHGLNPDDPNDSLEDNDGDLFTNIEEYLMGLDPNQFNGGEVSLVAVQADAYEKGGNSAYFTITRENGRAEFDLNITADGGDNPDEAASENDYEVVYALDGTLVEANGSITIGAGIDSVDVFIRPVRSAEIEYRENWRVNLVANANYDIGANSTETGNIYEASDDPKNTRIYNGAFRVSPGANGAVALGQATLKVYGTNTKATVIVDFDPADLSSGQTTSHIHISNLVNPDTTHGPHIHSIPDGPFDDHTWDIVPTNGYSGQDLIDALNDQSAHFLYLNIHTVNNLEGELRAKFDYIPPFEAPDPEPAIPQLTGDDLTRDVVRFLTQATFGPTEETIDALVDSVINDHNGDQIAAYSQWIDDQFALDQTSLYQYGYHADSEHWILIGREGPHQGYRGIGIGPNGHPHLRNHRGAFWTIATNAHDQLRQRIGFALSQIFVISRGDSRVQHHAYGTAKYMDALSEHADGNYRSLIEYISRSPMMGTYLSHLQNQKEQRNAQGIVVAAPDENYAREIMQLFSIGLQILNPDGTVALVEGTPQVTYTNEDITELARVFTGWSYSKRPGDYTGPGAYRLVNLTQPADFNHSPNFNRYISPQFEFPMRNFTHQHDFGAKTVLGSTIPSDLSPEADLGSALDILYNHDNLGPFLAELMIKRMTHSNPSKAYVYRVAQAFDNGDHNGKGSGVRGDFGAMVRAILLDYEARSLVEADEPTYGKQKEPVLRMTQTIRALGAKSNEIVSSIVDFGYPADQLDNFPQGVTRYNIEDLTSTSGQSPHNAPSVFNWFLPDYDPGGDIADAGLVAPEMQITNELQVVGANNDLYRLVFESSGFPGTPLPIREGIPRTASNIRVDYTHLESIYQSASGSDADKAEALIDHLDRLLTGGRLKHSYGDSTGANPRDIIINATIETSSDRRLKTAVYLVCTSPEFIHQK